MRTNGSCVLWAAVIAGLSCGGPGHEQPAHPEPPAAGIRDLNRPWSNKLDATRHRLHLVARAQQALAARWPLDYRRPFVTEPEDTTAATLYLEACLAGDKPSCWIAATLEYWLGKARAIVLANCRAGDIMSCRALPTDEDFGDAPGWVGRTEACQTNYRDKSCDLPGLRRECEAGFAHSCRLILEAGASDNGLGARAVVFARAGCDALIESDCNELEVSAAATPADRQMVDDRECALRILACGHVSERDRVIGDMARARDIAEQVCQYDVEHSRHICLELGEHYASGMFPEPIQGRGEALINWACSDDSLRDREPSCKTRAAEHQAAHEKPR